MLSENIKNIYNHTGVKFHDYSRAGKMILISSGFGLGLALMDVFIKARYFLDVDEYRASPVDWELVGYLLSHSSLASGIILAGWFTIDTPKVVNQIQVGIQLIPTYFYRGGLDNLNQFIRYVEKSQFSLDVKRFN